MLFRDDSHTAASQAGELRSALSNRYCRFVLHYFDDASGDTASVEGLSTAFARENEADADEVAVQLHHVALPKLSSVGVVEYDARSEAVQYHGHPRLGDQLRIGEAESGYVVEVR